MISSEYSIKYEEAKIKNNYFSTKDVDLLKIKEDLLKCIKNDSMCPLSGDNVLYIVEFGYMDIELTVYDVINNKLDIGFYVCVKGVDDKWESHGFCDECFNLGMLDLDRDKFEKLMFEFMIGYAKKHLLCWSGGN